MNVHRTTLAALAVLVTAILVSPLHAQQHQEQHGTKQQPQEADQVADQLQETTAHFEQMLSTLRENPDLEGQWTSPEVMAAVTTTGRLSTRLAREAARLAAHLDSLRSQEMLSKSEPLKQHLGGVQAEVERTTEGLRSVLKHLDRLRSVVHGGEGHDSGR